MIKQLFINLTSKEVYVQYDDGVRLFHASNADDLNIVQVALTPKGDIQFQFTDEAAVNEVIADKGVRGMK